MAEWMWQTPRQITNDFRQGLAKLRCVRVRRNRCFFENVHTEIGGGEMLVTGSVSYGEGFGALRYDMSGHATNVRVVIRSA